MYFFCFKFYATKKISELPRVDRKRLKIDPQTLPTALGDASGACGRFGNGPPSSRSVSGLPWGRFLTAFGHSWRAEGAPRSALGRHLGALKPSQAHPDASLQRPWAPKSVQDRFFIDLGSIWGGFSSIFARAVCDEGTKAESQKGVV